MAQYAMSENWQEDKKWRIAGAGSSQGVFTCADFGELAGKDLVGAYNFMRYGKGNSCFSRRIFSFDGTKITWDTEKFFSTLYAGEDGSKGNAPNSKFYIAGALDLLDAPGEWMVKDSVLYIYPPLGRDPNQETIMVTTNDYIVNQADAITDITIEGIDFFASSFKLTNTFNDNIKIKNTYFTYIGAELLWVNNPTGIDKPIFINGNRTQFENCLFAGAQTTTLELDGVDLTIENCVFMENNRDGNFKGRSVKLRPKGTYKINKNTFFNNCGDAMSIGSIADNVEIETLSQISYNNICNAGLYNTDVSGIYAPILGHKFGEVHHNWIHNVKGNGYRLDMAGYDLSLHHNAFWQSKRGMSVEGYKNFNIYNNTSILHSNQDQINQNQATRQDYLYAPKNDAYPPIEDWNVLNNIFDILQDGYPPSEKTNIANSKKAGTLHPERAASSSFLVYNRGTIQGNIFGKNYDLFTSTNLTDINLVPIDNTVLGGVEPNATLIAEHVTSLDSFRGAYEPGAAAWYPGSAWMPYGLQVVKTMAEAEAFAKQYKYISIVPEINVRNLATGLLNGEDNNDLLTSITWPDYERFGEIPNWDSARQDTIPDFAADKFEYKLVLPANFKGIPVLSGTVDNPLAKLEIERATSFKGTIQERTTTFTVTNNNSGNKTVYSVVFELGAATIVNSKPFISEIIRGRYNSDDYVELYNPKNNSEPLDMSKYLLVNVPVGTNEADVLATFQGKAYNDAGIHYCYVPGYKYAYDNNGSTDPANWAWKDGIVGAITKDDSVQANVVPGDVFVISSFGVTNDGNEFKILGDSTSTFVDVNLTYLRNKNFLNSTQTANVANYTLGRALFLYEIKNDAILDGTKGLWEDLNDYELVDRLQWDAATMGNVISGYPLAGTGVRLIRKPEVQVGNLLANKSFDADFNTSEWIHQSRNAKVPAGWVIGRPFMGTTLGSHNYVPSDDGFISTVTSTVYIVDPGNEGDLKIAGDITNTTVSSFISNLIKGNPLQNLSMRNDSGILADDAMIAVNDTLIVVSANERYTTKYVIKTGVLSNNTALYEVVGSGIVVDNVNHTISGINALAPLSEIFDSVTCDPLSYITVIDTNNNQVPFSTQSLDPAITVPVVTKVFGGLQFEVVAEDGTIAKYTLILDTTPSEAFITSNVFTVNQDNKTIDGPAYGISLERFMSYIYPSGNATVVVKDENDSVQNSTLLQFGNYVFVTSEDETVTAKYTINLSGTKEEVKYLTIKKSVNIESFPVKTVKVDNAYSYAIKTSGGGTLTANISPAVSWLTFNEGILSGTPTASDLGTDVAVTFNLVSDEDSISQEFILKVIPNVAVAITSTPTDYALVNKEYRYEIATIGSGVLSFDPGVADDFAGWLTLEGNTLVGTPALADVGFYTILLNFDNELEHTSQTYTINVSEIVPLLFTSTPVVESNIEEVYTYVITTQGAGQLSLSTSPEVSWLSLNGSTLSGTPTASDATDVNVTITFTNGIETVKQEFLISFKSLSVGSNEKESRIKVYPNPASEYVQLNNLTVGSTVSLISNIGSVVASYIVTESDLIIPTSNLASGIYYLRIDLEMSSKTVKLIINHR